MHPKFLLDENVSRILWDAIRSYNNFAEIPISALRVGDPADLPRNSDDRTLLLWAERNGYIVISHDKKTLPDHLAAHLASGHHLPGLFLFSYYVTPEEIVELLAVAAQATNEEEWQDLIEYLG